jgi:hypothetical protein
MRLSGCKTRGLQDKRAAELGTEEASWRAGGVWFWWRRLWDAFWEWDGRSMFRFVSFRQHFCCVELGQDWNRSRLSWRLRSRS